MLGASLFGSSPALPSQVSSVVLRLSLAFAGQTPREMFLVSCFLIQKGDREQESMGPQRRVLWEWVSRCVSGERGDLFCSLYRPTVLTSSIF